MRQYFEKMEPIGRDLTENERKRMEENVTLIKKEEEIIEEAKEKVKNAGIPAERINQRGENTAWQRLEMLVDPGTFLPLNSIYNPFFNAEGSTGLVNGIGKISGRYACIIASDNKVLAGAWVAGQGENIFRVQEMAEILNVPLVWVLNCSGVKLTEQEEVYAGRRSGGHTFFRHDQLIQKGIPIIAGVYGTNPAGGGYHGISPTIMFAHKNANIAVGGGGIVSGMSPKGGFDLEGAELIIDATRKSMITRVSSLRCSIRRRELSGLSRNAWRVCPCITPIFSG
jgi:glutaconyl-CoA decarboxylase